MKKNLYLSLVVGLSVLTLVTGCGSNGGSNSTQTITVNDNTFTYKADVAYYGNITIGESSMNMLSTYDMLSETDMESDIMTAYGYRDSKTKDKFYYQRNIGDNYYEVEFDTYNSTYEDNGCLNCGTYLSNYIELPKGITYNSTVDDVLRAYGEPLENKEYLDQNYRYRKNTNGDEFGNFQAIRLIYDYEGEDEEEEVEDRKLFGRRNKDKVVAMPQANTNAIKMVISQPTTFEQSDEICSFLKEKKSVIVNLEYVNKDVARRIVDFISGGVYALDGYIQKVSNSIFLVAPSNYEITNEMAREEMKSKLSVSWLKNNGIN